MTRRVYDVKVSKAFTQAAIDARKSGKTWSQVFHIAKSKGYEGSCQGIIDTVFASGKVAPGKRGRKPRQKA